MKLTYICDAGTLGNMLGRLWVSTLGFLALFIGISTVKAEAADTLRVAMTGQYMPLHGEENGKKVGFEVDVAHVLGQQLGKQVVFVSRSELGMGTLQAVAEGKADIGLSAITPTAERRKIVDFSAPIGAVRYRVVHDGGPSPCEKEVYAAQGPAYEAAKKALGIAAKSCQDDAAAIQMVQDGKARCAIVEEPSITKLTNPGTLRVFKTAVGEAPIALAVPKGKLREIRDLLLDRNVSRSVAVLQQKWDVKQAFGTFYDSIILPYAEWPVEIKTAWVAAPDFGMRYYRELIEAYQARRLNPVVEGLTKQSDERTTVAVLDSLIKLASDYPDALHLVNSDLMSRVSLDGKNHLVLILDAYLSIPKEKHFIVLSGIATSILKAGAARYVELPQLHVSLCKRSESDTEVYNRSTLPELLGVILKQSPPRAVRIFLYDYFKSCPGKGEGLSENEVRPGSISWYEDPITYAIAKLDDWRFTEELLRKLLQDALTVEGGEGTALSILTCTETVAIFNPKLTKRLEPIIVEARAQINRGETGRDETRR